MDINKVRSFFEDDQFAKLSGIELLEAKPGEAMASMKIENKHLNAAGVVQGGAIFTLADFAFAVASNTKGLLALAIQANVCFIRSVSEGVLKAKAVEVTEPGRLGNYRVEVRNEKEDLIATFDGIVYRKKEKLNF